MQSAQSIKIRGRNKNAVSEQYFGLPRVFWGTLAQELNAMGNVRARFYPDNSTGYGYHLRFHVEKLPIS